LKKASPVDSDALLKNIVKKNNLIVRADREFLNLTGTANAGVPASTAWISRRRRRKGRPLAYDTRHATS
jgi:hypothetical protein